MGLLKLYSEVMTGQEEPHTALLRPWAPSSNSQFVLKLGLLVVLRVSHAYDTDQLKNI